jgi:putative transposase
MATTPRKPYLTDLTDEQWAILPPLIPLAKPGGRPRAVDMREVINTILYLTRTGCQWEMLPHDWLPKSTVDEYFAPWRHAGTWQHLRDALRADVRQQQAPSQAPPPSAASIDSPSVQTTAPGGERGDDGGKNSNGRKRHVGVDPLGLLLAVVVTRAAIDAAGAAPKVLAPLGHACYPRVAVVWGDRTYHQHGLNQWMAGESRWAPPPAKSRSACPQRSWRFSRDNGIFDLHGLSPWCTRSLPTRQRLGDGLLRRKSCSIMAYILIVCVEIFGIMANGRRWTDDTVR